MTEFKGFRIPKTNYIKSIGIEVEGGIQHKHLYRRLEEIAGKTKAKRIEIGFDGSVNVENCDIFDAEIRFWSENPVTVFAFAYALFNRYGIRQNRTCGNHHHFRLREDILYGLFMDLDVINQYIAEYRDFAYKVPFKLRKLCPNKVKYIPSQEITDKYLRRLNNNYCKTYYSVKEIEENIYGANRYRIFNFSSLFEHQETLEIRIMPYAICWEEYFLQLQFNINTIEKLVKYFDTTIKEKIDLDIPKEETIEGVVI